MTFDASEPLACAELTPCEVAGQRVRRFCLRNRVGVRVELMEFGATVLEVALTAADGRSTVITRGLATPESYAHNKASMGAICGRYAGRISNAGFELLGRHVALTRNHGAHHLHGGTHGFGSRVWTSEPFRAQGRVGVHFDYSSEDGEEGYPGRLDCRVSYSLDDASRLRIDYAASVHGEPTVVNLTNHCYWNLSEQPDVLGHLLQLAGTSILEVDDELIPTGRRLPVQGTAFDFSARESIGARMASLPEGSDGFDHCYLHEQSLHEQSLPDGDERQQHDTLSFYDTLSFVARVLDPASGRGMAVYTDQPAVVFYTGNFLDGSAEVGGHHQHAAFCLECQQLPDAPNQPDFPSTVVYPGEPYSQTSVYQFYVQPEDPDSGPPASH